MRTAIKRWAVAGAVLLAVLGGAWWVGRQAAHGYRDRRRFGWLSAEEIETGDGPSDELA